MNSKFLASFIALMILSNTFMSCKKTVDPLHKTEQVTSNKKKFKNAKRTDGIPSFKEFIFSRDLIDYQKPIIWEDNGKKRTLLKYVRSGEEKLYKYLLVEESDDQSWTSMYVVSGKELTGPGKLLGYSIKKEEVINYDKYISGDNNCMVNGVQLEKVNYNLDETLTGSTDKMMAECGKEYCIDSWLITYGEETGTIYYIEYSPICGVVHCGGGGGGSPATPPSLPTMEVGQNILDQSVATDLHMFGVNAVWSETRAGVIRMAKVITWKFLDMHVWGSAHVFHTAAFNTVLYAQDNIPPANRVWKWESFQYAGNSQSAMYTLGGYPPCLNATMDANAACGISGDQLTTDVDLSYNLKLTITCLGGLTLRDINGNNHATFLAATYAPAHV